MSRKPGRKAGKCLESREVINKTAAYEKPTNIEAGKCLKSREVIKKAGGGVGL
jgi:hypothetical protein